MWRSLAENVDELVLAFHRIMCEPAFRASAPGAPPTLDALVAEQEARPPRVCWPARFERRLGRLRVALPVLGVETFADFHPARAPGADTLVIYHHGLGEFPHDASAARILGRGRLADRVDWIALRAAHHETLRAMSDRLLLSHENFARSLACSVFVARALAAGLRGRYRHLVLAGVSMGGVIALIEAAIGSRFDLCVPINAGPDIADVLLRSSFARVVDRRYARRAGRALGADLPSRLAGEGPPIRAILATYDRLFRFDAQRAAYARIPRAAYEVISAGHVTAPIQFRAMAAFVERTLEAELWARRGVPASAA
jgi:hypothetical protein